MNVRNMAIAAIFVGPLACAADQLASFALVQRAAKLGGAAPTAAVTVFTAIVILSALSASLASWRRVRTGDTAPRGKRADLFLAVVGVATNLFFLFVAVVGFGLPQWFLRPTD